MSFDITMALANSKKGSFAHPLLSDERAILTQPYGGKWYHAAKQGRLFTGNAAAAGVTIPIYSNTAQVFGLWNPANSDVLGVLVNLAMTYVSGTAAAGGYCLGLLRDVGALAGTAAPISAFTKGTPERGRLGGKTGGNTIQFTPSACTVTTGLMVIARQLGLNVQALTAADATCPGWTWVREFDGDLVLEPGNALFLCGNIAVGSVWAPSLTWAEEPI